MKQKRPQKHHCVIFSLKFKFKLCVSKAKKKLLVWTPASPCNKNKFRKLLKTIFLGKENVLLNLKLNTTFYV